MNAYVLTTVARLKSYLGITVTTHDSLLGLLIDAVTDFIEDECDRRFKQTDYTNVKLDGEGNNQLLLPNWPVVSGETFTLYKRRSTSGYGSDDAADWDAIDSNDYRLDLEAGIINANFKFSEGFQNYKVNYTAGYNFVNTGESLITLASVKLSDLELIAWKLVGREFQKRKGTGDIRKMSLYNLSVEFDKEAYSDDEIKQVLEKYQRVTF